MGVGDHNTLVYVEQGGGKLVIANADQSYYVKLSCDASGNLVIEDESGSTVTVTTSTGTVTPA